MQDRLSSLLAFQPVIVTMMNKEKKDRLESLSYMAFKKFRFL
jgi:hypothetical protein